MWNLLLGWYNFLSNELLMEEQLHSINTRKEHNIFKDSQKKECTDDSGKTHIKKKKNKSGGLELLAKELQNLFCGEKVSRTTCSC